MCGHPPESVIRVLTYGHSSGSLNSGQWQKREFPVHFCPNTNVQRVFWPYLLGQHPFTPAFGQKTTGCSRSFLLCSASTCFWTVYLPFRWATRTDPTRIPRITRKTARVTVEIKHTSPDHKNDLQSDVVYRSIDNSWCCQFSQRTAASGNDRQCPLTGNQYCLGGASSWSLQ